MWVDWLVTGSFALALWQLGCGRRNKRAVAHASLGGREAKVPYLGRSTFSLSFLNTFADKRDQGPPAPSSTPSVFPIILHLSFLRHGLPLLASQRQAKVAVGAPAKVLLALFPSLRCCDVHAKLNKAPHYKTQKKKNCTARPNQDGNTVSAWEACTVWRPKEARAIWVSQGR